MSAGLVAGGDAQLAAFEEILRKLAEPPAIRAQVDVAGRSAPLEHLELVGARVKQRSRRADLVGPRQEVKPIGLPAGGEVQANGDGDVSRLRGRDRHGDLAGPGCYDTHEFFSLPPRPVARTTS